MKIYIRPITLEDGKSIVKWRNTAIIKSHCFDKSEISLEDNEKFFNEKVLTGKYRQFIVERSEEVFGVASYPIATIYLKNIDNISHRSELCFFTSDDEEWNSESQSIAIKMLVVKAFKEYDIHKLYSYVFVNNRDEVELLMNSGFSIEAKLEKEATDIDGNYCDVYRMCIINQ